MLREEQTRNHITPERDPGLASWVPNTLQFLILPSTPIRPDYTFCPRFPWGFPRSFLFDLGWRPGTLVEALSCLCNIILPFFLINWNEFYSERLKYHNSQPLLQLGLLVRGNWKPLNGTFRKFLSTFAAPLFFLMHGKQMWSLKSQQPPVITSKCKDGSQC